MSVPPTNTKPLDSASVLNPAQLAFVTSPIQDCRVIGNPGCGKTRSIIEFINHKGTTLKGFSNGSFLILTFSKMAQMDFLKKGKASGSPKLYSSSNVRTIHSLAYFIYTKLTGSTSTYLNTLVLSTAMHLAKFLPATHGEHDSGNTTQVREWLKSLDFPEGFAAKIGATLACTGEAAGLPDLGKQCTPGTLRVIVVDEAQDVSRNQYLFTMILARVVGAKVVMVGDPNQNIYQFQGGSDRFLLNHSKVEWNLLTNYRSTDEIIALLNSIRPHSDRPRMEGTGVKGCKVCVFNDSPEAIGEFIVAQVLAVAESGVDLSEVAIIGSTKKSNTNYMSLGLSFAAHVLKQAGVDYLEHYSDGKDASSRVAKCSAKDNHVNLLTCHGSKGLEFHTTIVINYHLTTFTRVPTLEDYRQHCYLWYVGLSRAKKSLIMCIDSNKKVHPSFAKVPLVHVDTIGSRLKIVSEDDTKFRDQDDSPCFTVTDMVRDNTLFTEEAYMLLLKGMAMSEDVTTTRQWTSQGGIACTLGESAKDSKYAMLFGEIMELAFQMEFMCFQHNEEPVDPVMVESFIKSINQQTPPLLFVDSNLQKAIRSLKAKKVLSTSGCIYYAAGVNAKRSKSMSAEERSLVTTCLKFMDNMALASGTQPEAIPSLYAQVAISNNAQVFDKGVVFEMMNELRTTLLAEEPSKEACFDLVMDYVVYRYAFENEKKAWLLEEHKLTFDLVWKKELFAFYPNVTAAVDIVRAELATIGENSQLKFEVNVAHPLLPVFGRADAVMYSTGANGELVHQRILELKFMKDSSSSAPVLAQCWTYLLCSGMSECLLLNIKDLKTTKVSISKENLWPSHVLLSKICCTKMESPIFILDLETNCKNRPEVGKEMDFPKIDANTMEIIDHHIVEMSTGSVVSTGFVRNRWPITNSHIHHITDSMAAGGISPSELTRRLEEMLLLAKNKADNTSALDLAATLVAHNGNGFDFKVLEVMGHLPDKCSYTKVDSINVLRPFVKLDNTHRAKHGGQDSVIASMRLEEIYQKCIQSDYVQTHRAAMDVDMIVEVFKHYHITAEYIKSLTMAA
jgi:hypothetical protein